MNKCAAAVLLVYGAASYGADPAFHRFELWGRSTAAEKLDFYWGFTNGLLVGATHPLRSDATPGRQLVACLSDDAARPTTSQALAMIDKYFSENPEKWNTPIGGAMVEALMVKGGPCALFEETGWKPDHPK